MKYSIYMIIAGMLLSGCGQSLNNDRFEEDALYLEALPRSEALHLESPESEASATSSGSSTAAQACVGTLTGLESSRAGQSGTPDAECDPDGYRHLTYTVAQSVNGVIVDVLSLLDRIREQPPTERTEMSRVWGPYRVSEAPEVWLKLEVVREAPRFRYLMTLGTERAYQPDVVMSGTFVPGSVAAEGEGAFTFDLTVRQQYFPTATQVGQLDVDYSTLGDVIDFVMEGHQLGSTTEPARIDESYAFYSPGDRSGLFYFDRPISGDPETGMEERISIWSQWDPTSRGRADIFRYRDAPDQPLASGTECWNDLQQVTYYVGECGQQGSVETCLPDVVGWNE